MTFSIFLGYSDRTTTVWQFDEFALIVVVSFCINLVFVGDLVLNFVVLGPKNIFKEKKFIFFELALQVGILIWAIFILNGQYVNSTDGYYSDISMFFLIRHVRGLSFFTEIPSFKLISATMQRITIPIIGKFLFLYLVFY